MKIKSENDNDTVDVNIQTDAGLNQTMMVNFEEAELKLEKLKLGKLR